MNNGCFSSLIFVQYCLFVVVFCGGGGGGGGGGRREDDGRIGGQTDRSQ